MPTSIPYRYEIIPSSSAEALRLMSSNTSIDTTTTPSTTTLSFNQQLNPLEPLNVTRKVYDHEEFDEEFDFVPQSQPFINLTCSCRKIGRFAKNLLPPIKWLPKYKKVYFFRDLIVGLTICVLSIPQAMAYASLANLPPVVGLYSSFFPTLLYAIFGTSKHIMFGMFAVPALMVGAIVDELATPLADNATAEDFKFYQDETILICSTITFCLGIIFAIMALAQLHVLTAYLSNHLVTGFTTAASFHVLASQLPKLISIKVPSHAGLFKLGFILRDLALGLPNANYIAALISLSSITILMIGRYLINPKVTKKIKIPIPFELIVIIATTLISYYVHLEEKKVSVVGDIPTGLPLPALPDFKRMCIIFPKSLSIAVVIFGVTLSVGKLFAKKHDYKVSPAQDLRALAFIHLVCSFFSCHPGSGSLSRSAVASQLGSKSQIAGITSASVVLIVLLWAGPWFYYLPRCVLGSIIFVALQSMFIQLKELPKLWKVSKIDFAIWMVAFVATFFYDVTEGLLIAVGFALFTIILRTQIPRTISLGRAGNTELYRDKIKYRRLDSLQNILILRYDGPLLFVNAQRFVETSAKLVAKEYFGSPEVYEDLTSLDGEDCDQAALDKSIRHLHDRYLIVDVSTVSQVDQMGVEAIKELNSEVNKLGTTVLIAAPKSPVRELFAACGLFNAVPKCLFFPSVHDAVLFAQHKMNNP